MTGERKNCLTCWEIKKKRGCARVYGSPALEGLGSKVDHEVTVSGQQGVCTLRTWKGQRKTRARGYCELGSVGVLALVLCSSGVAAGGIRKGAS